MTPQKNLPNVNVCLCLGLLLLIGACSEPARSRRLPIATIRVGEKEISVEVARTPEQRSRGLMFRRDLGEDEGMLFVFPRVRPLSFYMKHTYVPLAIAFIRDDLDLDRITDHTVDVYTNRVSSGAEQFGERRRTAGH